MKKIKLIILSAVLLISISGCKDKASESLPRTVYTGSPEGIVLHSAPDAKSEIVTVIPFAEKVTLTENSDRSKSASAETETKWYRTQWNGKSGWITGSSVSSSESLSEQIKKSFTEQRSNLSEDFIRLFESAPVSITDKYNYPGGEMQPAKIFFLSSGAMVLNSQIFTEKFSNTFFQYEFMNDGKLLKIKFVDTKLNFTDYADMENSSSSVFKIDRNERTIIYHIKDNAFFFFNWGFVKD